MAAAAILVFIEDSSFLEANSLSLSLYLNGNEPGSSLANFSNRCRHQLPNRRVIAGC